MPTWVRRLRQDLIHGDRDAGQSLDGEQVPAAGFPDDPVALCGWAAVYFDDL